MFNTVTMSLYIDKNMTLKKAHIFWWPIIT